MRSAYSKASLLFLLAASCATPIAARQAQSSVTCNPESAGALVARPSDATITPARPTVMATSLSLVEAQYVKGPCVDDIEYFLGGHAFLRSGQIFLIRDDGEVKLRPPQGLRGDYDVAIEQIASLPEYKKVMATQVRLWLTPAGKRESYVGLFKSKSDYVIVKFDMLNGKPIKEAEILVRSRLPISALDYLPAPDTPSGQIGFVQRAGTGKAWLYTYSWHHGITGRQP